MTAAESLITKGDWNLDYDALDPEGDGWEPVGISVGGYGRGPYISIVSLDVDYCGPFISETQPSGMVARANAQLMVTSPKLLDACELAVAMRKSQRIYFKHKTHDNLMAALDLEKRADEALAAAIKEARNVEGQEGYRIDYSQPALLLP